jgi:hypothetical protein
MCARTLIATLIHIMKGPFSGKGLSKVTLEVTYATMRK